VINKIGPGAIMEFVVGETNVMHVGKHINIKLQIGGV
jgi:hypothetical protein